MSKNGRMRMREIKKILSLYRQTDLSSRAIAKALTKPKSTVCDYIHRFNKSGLTSEDLSDKSDEQIYHALFPEEKKSNNQAGKNVLPDFSAIHLELKKKYVTRALLWEEYKESYPDNHYGYTHFCNLYKAWQKRLHVTMRVNHVAGEKMFLDYSGLTWEIIDTATGEIIEVEVFVASLGASGYTFAEASLDQTKQSFINSSINAFEFFEGTSQILVPDNLKSAVTKADKYDPTINETYQDMAEHYGCVVIPARPYRAQDKAKVELSVKLVQRWILAKLRHRQFFSIAELNKAIYKLLDYFNDKIIKRYGKNRYQLYLELDKPALNALPKNRYVIRDFKYCKVNIDYHIEVAGCFYSVPYQLSGQEVFVIYTATCIEILHHNKRVAIHNRLHRKGAFSTNEAHMASAHRVYATWTPSRLISWAEKYGENTRTLIAKILESKSHPEMGFRSCMAILNTAKRYNDLEAIELTSQKMLAYNLLKASHFKEILKNKTYKDSAPKSPVLVPEAHENVRGRHYYR